MGTVRAYGIIVFYIIVAFPRTVSNATIHGIVVPKNSFESNHK